MAFFAMMLHSLYDVEEYYVSDTNDLEIWIRGDHSLGSISEVHNWVSTRLGIRFDISDRPPLTDILTKRKWT